MKDITHKPHVKCTIVLQNNKSATVWLECSCSNYKI